MYIGPWQEYYLNKSNKNEVSGSERRKAQLIEEIERTLSSCLDKNNAEKAIQSLYPVLEQQQNALYKKEQDYKRPRPRQIYVPKSRLDASYKLQAEYSLQNYAPGIGFQFNDSTYTPRTSLSEPGALGKAKPSVLQDKYEEKRSLLKDSHMKSADPIPHIPQETRVSDKQPAPHRVRKIGELSAIEKQLNSSVAVVGKYDSHDVMRHIKMDRDRKEKEAQAAQLKLDALRQIEDEINMERKANFAQFWKWKENSSGVPATSIVKVLDHKKDSNKTKLPAIITGKSKKIENNNSSVSAINEKLAEVNQMKKMYMNKIDPSVDIFGANYRGRSSGDGFNLSDDDTAPNTSRNIIISDVLKSQSPKPVVDRVITNQDLLAVSKYFDMDHQDQRVHLEPLNVPSSSTLGDNLGVASNSYGLYNNGAVTPPHQYTDLSPPMTGVSNLLNWSKNLDAFVL